MEVLERVYNKWGILLFLCLPWKRIFDRNHLWFPKQRQLGQTIELLNFWANFRCFVAFCSSCSLDRIHWRYFHDQREPGNQASVNMIMMDVKVLQLSDKVLMITSWHQKNKIRDILTSWKIVLKSWRARPLHCLWVKDTKSSIGFVRPLTSIYYAWIFTTLRHF